MRGGPAVERGGISDRGSTLRGARDEMANSGVSPEAAFEWLAAILGLHVTYNKSGRRSRLTQADGSTVEAWREGYPYPHRLERQPYRFTIRCLQIELLKLQQMIKADGRRLLVVFEGRDAAGKGGTIRRFAEVLNPRGVRVVALEKPGAHEQGENYLRRYLQHVPAAGQIVLLDRSWYNRAGVERVMGFCQPREYQQFLADVPEFERTLTANGVDLVKLWFSVTRTEQLKRMMDRHADPVKRWKLTSVDIASLDRWDDYTAAAAEMFARTDLPYSRWTVIRSNDKRRARIEAIRYVLSQFDYRGRRADVVGVSDPLIVGPAAMAEVGAGRATLSTQRLRYG
jgi:polyphosphate kinase